MNLAIEALSVEVEAQSVENDALSVEVEAQSVENDALSVDVEARSVENDALSVEVEARSVENDVLSVEVEARSVENDALSVEVEARRVENDALSVEVEARSVENDALSVEVEAQSVEDEVQKLIGQVKIFTFEKTGCINETLRISDLRSLLVPDKGQLRTQRSPNWEGGFLTRHGEGHGLGIISVPTGWGACRAQAGPANPENSLLAG